MDKGVIVLLITKRIFGEENGQQIYEYTLKNTNGIEISCLNYGCAITKIITPDRKGNFENIVLGFDVLYKNITFLYLNYGKNPSFYSGLI